MMRRRMPGEEKNRSWWDEQKTWRRRESSEGWGDSWIEWRRKEEEDDDDGWGRNILYFSKRQEIIVGYDKEAVRKKESTGVDSWSSHSCLVLWRCRCDVMLECWRRVDERKVIVNWIGSFTQEWRRDDKFEDLIELTGLGKRGRRERLQLETMLPGNKKRRMGYWMRWGGLEIGKKRRARSLISVIDHNRALLVALCLLSIQAMDIWRGPKLGKHSIGSKECQTWSW